MKKIINSILNRLSPMQNNNIYRAAQTVIKCTSNLCKPGTDIINKNNSEISQHSQLFGWACEQLQAIGFNINTEVNNLEARVDQVSMDRMTKYDPDIYIKKVGEVIVEIQAKVSCLEPIKQPIYSEHLPMNSEIYNIYKTENFIDIDSIKSVRINQDFAQWVTENPYLAANLMLGAATVGELSHCRIQAAIINATTNILLKSIKPLKAYCKNEKNMDQAEVYNLLQLSVDSLKHSLIRGTAIRVIQNLIKSRAFAALEFTISIPVIPVLIRVMQDEITIQQGISIVGIKAFTSGIVTTVVLLFPSVGLALLSRSVLQTIWEKITPEWQKFIIKTANTTVDSTQKGIIPDHQHLQRKSRNSMAL